MKFNVKIDPHQDVSAFLKKGYTREFALYAISKGMDSPEKVNAFCNTKLSALRKVAYMKDANAFVSRLMKAIKAKEHIVIYGDYDVDGIMASYIVSRSVRHIAPDVDIQIFINNRFSEGYGMNVAGMKRLTETYPDTELIITVDNGINATDGIRFALDHGMDVIVSDHHEQSGATKLVKGVPCVCEKRLDEDVSARQEMCGAELARGLMNLLYYRMGLQDENKSFLSSLFAYSGMATITDIVPLNAANHKVAHQALRLMEKDDAELFWKVMKEKCDVHRYSETTFGFTYGPRINAPGRVTGTVNAALNALFAAESGDGARCEEAIDELNAINAKRQDWSDQDEKLALEMIEQNGYGNDKFIVLADERFREGINGLTAGRVQKRFKVPAIVLCPTEKDPEVYKGSARSIDGFNIFEALEECRDLLVTCGGHAQAAGLSVKKGKIDDLRKRLGEIAQQQIGEQDMESEDVDFVMNACEPSIKMIKDFMKLEPYGAEMEKPRFGFEGIYRFHDSRKGRHAILHVANPDGRGEIKVPAWNKLEEINALGLKDGDHIRFVGTPEINVYKDTESVQIVADEISKVD